MFGVSGFGVSGLGVLRVPPANICVVLGFRARSEGVFWD